MTVVVSSRYNSFQNFMFRGASRKGTPTYNFGKFHVANPVLYSEKLLSPVLVQLSVEVESLVMIPNKKN